MTSPARFFSDNAAPVHPAVLAAVPEAWTERLGRELGGVVARVPDAALPLAAGHVARG